MKLRIPSIAIVSIGFVTGFLMSFARGDEPVKPNPTKIDRGALVKRSERAASPKMPQIAHFRPKPPENVPLVKLTDANFAEEINNYKGAALVCFTARFAAPAKKQTETLSKMTGKYLGQVKFAEASMDDCQQTMGKFNIDSLPTTILFKNGAEVSRIKEAKDEAGIDALIKGAK